MLRIMIVNESGKVCKEFSVNTDSIPRALSLYEDEVGEFQHMTYKWVDDKEEAREFARAMGKRTSVKKKKSSAKNGALGGRPPKML